MRVLLTGASGSGKSTLLAELERRGIACISEPGRRVIAAARTGLRGALPWDDPRGFAVNCLRLARCDLHVDTPGPVVFDRGVTDALLHLARLGDPIPDFGALCPYDRVVLSPPWPDLAPVDPDRRQTPSEVLGEYAQLGAALAPASPVYLPQGTVAARADWFIARLAAWTSTETAE